LRERERERERECTWWAHMGGGNALAFKPPRWLILWRLILRQPRHLQIVRIVSSQDEKFYLEDHASLMRAPKAAAAVARREGARA
jgi:hypothetical protein